MLKKISVSLLLILSLANADFLSELPKEKQELINKYSFFTAEYNEIIDKVSKLDRKKDKSYRIYEDIYLTDNKKSLGIDTQDQKICNGKSFVFVDKNVSKCINFEAENYGDNKVGFEFLKNVTLNGKGDTNKIEELFDKSFLFLSYVVITPDMSFTIDGLEYIETNKKQGKNLTLTDFSDLYKKQIELFKKEKITNYQVIKLYIEKRDALKLFEYKNLNEILYSSKDYNRGIIVSNKFEKNENKFEIQFIPNQRYLFISKQFFNLSLNENIIEYLYNITKMSEETQKINF